MKKYVKRLLVIAFALMVAMGMGTSVFAYTALDDDGDRSKQTTAESETGATNNIVYASIGMFRLLDEGTSVAVNDDNTVTVTVKTAYTKSNNYDRIALTEYPTEDVENTLNSLAITADNLGEDGNITDTSVNSEGETTYSAVFTFTIPVSDVGKRIPFVMSAKGTWKNKNYYMTVLTESYNFARAEMALPETQFTYTGGEIKPEVALKVDDQILVENTDFTVKYENNIKPGTATAIVEGVQHNYAGTRAIEFEINKAPIKTATFSAIKAVTYSGKAKAPKFSVKFGGATLVKDKDYTAKYSNNTNAGTAKITVTGKGNFTGTKTLSFTIKKAAQKLTISGAQKTVKAKALKKKAILTSKVSVKGVKTTATYAKVKAGSSSKLTIDKKTGKIKVAKKTKKGTYKIKVKVTAAKSKNYKAATATKVIKVVVK